MYILTLTVYLRAIAFFFFVSNFFFYIERIDDETENVKIRVKAHHPPRLESVYNTANRQGGGLKYNTSCNVSFTSLSTPLWHS